MSMELRLLKKEGLWSMFENPLLNSIDVPSFTLFYRSLLYMFFARPKETEH